MLRKIDVFGNPYVGVFCRANESIACVPPLMREEMKHSISETLDVDVVDMSLDGSTLVGSLMALNSRCAILTHRASNSEVARLQRHVRVALLPHRLNAAGNNILANDKGAYLHAGLDQRSADLVAREMDVSVLRGSIANVRTVGSAGVVTNKGLLCHPRASEEERRTMAELFGVPVQIATANYGTPLVGACMAANTRGCVVGSTSTPIELGRIEDGLFL
jgi:translation initiation factor 6